MEAKKIMSILTSTYAMCQIVFLLLQLLLIGNVVLTVNINFIWCFNLCFWFRFNIFGKYDLDLCAWLGLGKVVLDHENFDYFLGKVILALEFKPRIVGGRPTEKTEYPFMVRRLD